MLILLVPFYIKNINPLLIGLILLLFSILISLNLIYFRFNSWFSFLIYLIIVGGVLILFLYFNRFIINIKILFKWKYIIIFILKLFLLVFLLINFYNLNLLDLNLFFNNFNEINSYYLNMINNINYRNNLIQFLFLYNLPNNFIILFILIYLFFLLTTIVKIILFKKKTVRKINYYKIFNEVKFIVKYFK